MSDDDLDPVRGVAWSNPGIVRRDPRCPGDLMARVIPFRRRPVLFPSDERDADMLTLATIYQMYRDAIDEGDLDRAAELEDEARRLLEHPE